MAHRFVGLWRKHRLLVSGFLLALALALFFMLRLVTGALYWSAVEHTDQPIAGWMPVRYVARSWDVPPEVLGEALGLGPAPGARRTIGEIAAARGESVETVAALLRAAIERHRAESDGDE